jgi:hypothetical protein
MNITLEENKNVLEFYNKFQNIVDHDSKIYFLMGTVIDLVSNSSNDDLCGIIKLFNNKETSRKLQKAILITCVNYCLYSSMPDNNVKLCTSELLERVYPDSPTVLVIKNSIK